jgi:hypothetical protein
MDRPCRLGTACVLDFHVLPSRNPTCATNSTEVTAASRFPVGFSRLRAARCMTRVQTVVGEKIAINQQPFFQFPVGSVRLPSRVNESCQGKEKKDFGPPSKCFLPASGPPIHLLPPSRCRSSFAFSSALICSMSSSSLFGSCSTAASAHRRSHCSLASSCMDMRIEVGLRLVNGPAVLTGTNYVVVYQTLVTGERGISALVMPLGSWQYSLEGR